MKNINLISFITFLIFLHSITNYMISAEAKEGVDDPVLDVKGNKLVEGDRYRILPYVIPGSASGGVDFYPMPNETCKYGVYQREFGAGRNLTFSLVELHLFDIIHESTDLNIEFSTSVGCAPSSRWGVSEYGEDNDHETKQYFVTAGGVSGNHEIESLPSSFQIEKATDDYYKFVFCPKTCPLCLRICRDVGIVIYPGGVRHLALSESPFLVKFERMSPLEPGIIRY